MLALQQSGDYQDCWLDLTKTDQISIGAWCTSNFWLWPGNNIFGCMKVPLKLQCSVPAVLLALLMLPSLEHGPACWNSDETLRVDGHAMERQHPARLQMLR